MTTLQRALGPIAMAVALSSSPAALAEGIPVDGLDWSWEDAGSRRWYVEAEIQLPMYLWFAAEENKEARVFAYQVRMVVSCPGAEEAGKKAWEVECAIDDIGLVAAALAPDRELLPPILDEWDTKLTGATIQIVQRRDGRISNFDLEDVSQANRRISRIHENIRLVLQRAIAGFDLQLPRKGASDYGAWAQNDSVLLWSPSARGTMGSAEIVHQVQSIDGDLVVIQTSGHAIVAPGEQTESGPRNLYDTRIESVAVFDRAEGLLSERVWTVLGSPTASSQIAEGTRGLDYGQRGRIVRVAPDTEPPPVGDTHQVATPGEEPTGLLQPWTPLGLPPRGQ